MPALFWILFAVWYGGLILALACEVLSLGRGDAKRADGASDRGPRE